MKAGSEAISSKAESLPKYVAPVAKGVAEAVSPAPAEKAVAKSKYPLTVGQRGAEAPLRGPEERVTPQLQEEDVLRRSPSTDPDAAQIIRGFDETQLNEIRADAATLQKEFGSDQTSITESGDVPGAVGEEVQSIVSSRAGELKKKLVLHIKLLVKLKLHLYFPEKAFCKLHQMHLMRSSLENQTLG